MKNNNISIIILLVFITTLGNVSCKKFIEVDNPDDQFNSNSVFSDSITAVSAITGIYSEMLTNRNLFSNSTVTLYAGMCADELYSYTPSLKDEFTKNQITQANHLNIDNSFWKPAYKAIYSANLAVEKLSQTQSLSTSLKNQLTGEAKFIRAFCYFHLVNLFGDVPLVLSTKYSESAYLARTPVTTVYNQIIADLIDAKRLLNTQYPTNERVRPNKWTASALLSRCYLYSTRWAESEIEADSIISSGQYSLVSNLNNVFLSGSNEAIWQLKPVRPGFNTYEGLEIIPASSFSIPTYLMTRDLYNSFENGDQRKNAWTNSRIYNGDTLRYPFKYKKPNGAVLTEYYMVFRLAEQYLIRAEANMQQNKLAEATDDVNIIRNRAGLPSISPGTISILKLYIEQERRFELFSEWGNRWYDLKRTSRADILLSPLKGSSWQTTDVLWPIPQPELNLNPSLIQNPGY